MGLEMRMEHKVDRFQKTSTCARIQVARTSSLTFESGIKPR